MLDAAALQMAERIAHFRPQARTDLRMITELERTLGIMRMSVGMSVLVCVCSFSASMRPVRQL